MGHTRPALPQKDHSASKCRNERKKRRERKLVLGVDIGGTKVAAGTGERSRRDRLQDARLHECYRRRIAGDGLRA